MTGSSTEGRRTCPRVHNGLGAPRTGGPAEGTELCGGWDLRQMALWWDSATGSLLAMEHYHTGGCMCDDDDIAEVRHVEMP